MEIKVITYNIDGLPETLDLNDLPWLFKPIAWVYKLFKGTTVIKINDNANKDSQVSKLAEKLAKEDADIIGVQEDFNYHDKLVQALPTYNMGTYSGGFDLSKAFSSIDWFPYPRFKADGLNIFSKHPINSEDIQHWDASYGYLTHANDKLTKKGFRAYQTQVSGVDIDVYILHMDADFYNPETCPDVSKDVEARRKQLDQLVSYILKKDRSVPSIIMGDTNCYPDYEWDVETLKNHLLDPINNVEHLSIEEEGYFIDKIFIINNDKAEHKLEFGKCYYDDDYNGLSDHVPFVGEIKIL